MEYRSGVTGGPHPGVDIFPDLSPRAKCSQGLHFPARMTGEGRCAGKKAAHEHDKHVIV